MRPISAAVKNCSGFAKLIYLYDWAACCSEIAILASFFCLFSAPNCAFDAFFACVIFGDNLRLVSRIDPTEIAIVAPIRYRCYWIEPILHKWIDFAISLSYMNKF